ncbi:MAG: immunoglobulin-like domain-containing protein [Bacteroidota bacterium]
MKINIILSILLISIIISCSKKDTTAPYIYMNGINPTYVVLNSTYSDAWATATDETDGNITSKIVATYSPSSGVNTNLVGSYYIYYNVSDAAGNTATQASREIVVVNEANNFIGKYNEAVSQSSNTVYCTDSVYISNTQNNRISFTKFGLDTVANISANIVNSSIFIPSQTVGSHTYYGNGIINSNAFLIIFTDSTSSAVLHCTSTFTKQ